MKLHLFHGRKDPDETPAYPGFDGPTIAGIKVMRATYNNRFLVAFRDHVSAARAHKITGWQWWGPHTLLTMTFEDMIQTKDGYFGDWEIQP